MGRIGSETCDCGAQSVFRTRDRNMCPKCAREQVGESFVNKSVAHLFASEMNHVFDTITLISQVLMRIVTERENDHIEWSSVVLDLEDMTRSSEEMLFELSDICFGESDKSKIDELRKERESFKIVIMESGL